MHINQPHASRAPIDDALLALRMVESRLCQSILGSPWGLAVPEDRHICAFVMVARGRCRLSIEGHSLELTDGEFVLLPRGSAHQLSDAAGTEPQTPGALRWESVRGRCIIDGGGEGESTHLLTGCLVFEASPLLAALPPVLSLPRETSIRWQEGVADLLRREALRPGPGSEVVLSHLVGLLAIGAIRRWLDDEEASDGFLRALRTPAIRTTLDRLHGDPARVWTLEELARTSGMSRSAFSQKFVDTVGEPPMRYWVRWRMSVARDWLLDGRCTVEEAADTLGYRSRAAFSRAYKANTGESPGQTRSKGRPQLRTLNERLMA